jgi:hypothetical protein
MKEIIEKVQKLAVSLEGAKARSLSSPKTSTQFILTSPGKHDVSKEDTIFYKTLSTKNGVTQRFIMPDANRTPGDGKGRSKYPRSEAKGDLTWKTGDGWHAFSATYKASTQGTTCIFQVFGRETPTYQLPLHPQTMLVLRTTGLYARTYCYAMTAAEKTWVDDKLLAGPEIMKRPFDITIFDNGDTTVAFLDGKNVWTSKPCKNRAAGYNYFNWGAYGQEISDVEVTNPVQMAV